MPSAFCLLFIFIILTYFDSQNINSYKVFIDQCKYLSSIKVTAVYLYNLFKVTLYLLFDQSLNHV